jgi:hypothetical protein
MQLDEVVEDPLEIVAEIGAPRVARELHALPGGELAEQLAGERGDLVLEAAELGGITSIAMRQRPEVAHALGELGDRLFERKDAHRTQRKHPLPPRGGGPER